MEPIAQLILLTAIAGVAIPVGGLLASIENIQSRWLEEELRHTILAFGGGALVSAVALVLIPEGVELIATWEAIAAFAFYGPPNPAMLKWRTIALVKLGRLEEARADMRSLLAIKPGLNVASARIVLDYLPKRDEYVAALQQAGLPE